ncbi:unnamed protein product, partial [Didymodactylos carnosus]
LGDTGADEIEKTDKLQHLWSKVAPLIKQKKLRAIFIEVSFQNNEKLANELYGHLTPKLLMKEMIKLRNLTWEQMEKDSRGSGTKGDALKGLHIIITHMKPSRRFIVPHIEDKEEHIKKELLKENQDLKLGLKFQYPKQGKLMRF